MIKTEIFEDKYGYTSMNGNAVLTFDIIKAADQLDIEKDKEVFNLLFKYRNFFAFGEYVIAANGETNNLPGEVRDLVRANHLLPEILKKQVRFMYGHGPFLYKEEWDEDNKLIRKPVTDQYPYIMTWLNSWKKNGLKQDFRSYAKSVIFEYYYNEGYFSKWLYNVSRRIGRNNPVRGLECIPSVKCRLAKKGTYIERDEIEDNEMNLVVINRWDQPHRYDAQEFPRFDHTDPFKYPVAVNYVADKGFDEEIYSIPTFYYGLKEWIKGSNLNPKYVNSYLKNSLNAKLHVLIPAQWINSKTTTLKRICDTNRDREQASEELITEYDGLKNIGTVFNYGMVQKLIDLKLQNLTNVLTGEGENQGKTFFSQKFRTEFGIEEWEIKEIPIKYKEFIQSILDYDKRTVEVILQGKGIDPSISNVSKDGIFQSSGSQVYYNYMIYLNSLTYAEEFICQDTNLALQINFPQLIKAGVNLGFFRNVPDRIQEISPDDRLERNVNN